MADIIEATETSLIFKVNGADRVFTFLNTYDKADLLRADLKRRQEAHDARKERKIKNLEISGIKGEQEYAELEAHDDNYPHFVTEQDWANFVNDTFNSATIYEKSLAKNYPSEAAELAKAANIPFRDKAKLCGLTVVEVVEKPDDKPDADPNALGVYSTPETSETGSKTKPASDTTSQA